MAGLPQGARVLDIGGGTGSWVIALAGADPELTATVFELPDVAAVADQRLRSSDVASRIDVVAGDLLTSDLPDGYRAFLLANVVHYFTPATNMEILRKIRRAAQPGALL